MTENTPLPAEAQIAWDAYVEMGRSKSAYFSYLQDHDRKYQHGGNPSLAESLQLEKLLKAHDEKVNAFNRAMKNVVDREARELLLQKISAGSAGQKE